MAPITWLRVVSLGAVALIAAALGDPLVESISNTGVFGRAYRDNVHTSVVPALTCGLVLVLVVLVARVFAAFGHAKKTNEDWLALLARDSIARSPMQSFPAVFCVQLCALWTMEHLESMIVAGSQSNGETWLGGPVFVSLAVHAMLCFAALKIFGSAMRGALSALAALVAVAVAAVVLLGRKAVATFRRRTEENGIVRAQGPHVRQYGGRAPPRLATRSLST